MKINQLACLLFIIIVIIVIIYSLLSKNNDNFSNFEPSWMKKCSSVYRGNKVNRIRNTKNCIHSSNKLNESLGWVSDPFDNNAIDNFKTINSCCEEGNTSFFSPNLIHLRTIQNNGDSFFQLSVPVGNKYKGLIKDIIKNIKFRHREVIIPNNTRIHRPCPRS
tara:strand:- start:153 stop:641 length:489 start_codon:yes stop_codon:yes gene_type:complete